MYPLSYVIDGATIENTLFKDGDDTNTFHALNPTQVEKIFNSHC